MFVRYDSESALSYSATRFLSIFAGFNFSDYNLPARWPYLVLYARYKTMIYEFAPAFGISFNLLLFKELYLTIRTSIFYCFNRERSERSLLAYLSSTGGEILPLMTSKSIKDKIGMNSQMLLMYPASKINTVFMFGCRYMYASVGSRGQGFKATVYEHLWGIMASVSYRLTITPTVSEEIEDRDSAEIE